MKDDLHETGTRVPTSQPFSVLLGAELLSLSEGAAEIRVPITTETHQQHGFVQEGLLCYVADNAIAFAGGSVFGPRVVTSELKINYLRPAPPRSLTGSAHRRGAAASPRRPFAPYSGTVRVSKAERLRLREVPPDLLQSGRVEPCRVSGQLERLGNHVSRRASRHQLQKDYVPVRGPNRAGRCSRRRP